MNSYPVSLSPSTTAELDLRDDAAIGLFLQKGISHEQGFLSLLIRFLGKDDVFYDIGANHGYYSLLLSEPERGLRAIVAFEPNAKLSEGLRRNTQNRPSVTVFSIGLSDRAGSATLKQDQGRSDMANLRPDATGKGQTVPLKSLDELINDGLIPPPNVIKLDVEGFEYKVLQGYTLRDVHQPVIFMEWVNEFAASVNASFNDLRQLFGENWEIYRIESSGHVRTDDLEHPRTTNDLLIVRRNTPHHRLAQELME